MNDAGLQPLCLVLYGIEWEPYVCILQLEIPAKNHEEKVNLNEFVAYFTMKELTGSSMNWIFSPPTSSTSVMYILPDRDHLRKFTDKPLHGYEFNLRTRECRQVKPVTGSKIDGQPVNYKGRVYVMEDLDYYDPDPQHLTFECYDPDKGKWEALNPFPIDATGKRPGYNGAIQAIALCGDTILHNLGGRQLWAYNITKNNWYQVQATDEDNEINWCYSIYGSPVVLESSIYALTTLSDDVILELSIERTGVDDDLVYTCVLRSKMSVPGLKPIAYNHRVTHTWTRNLVHLGDDNFCLVQSSLSHDDLRFQPIYLVILKLKQLEGGPKLMTVTNRHTYDVELATEFQFEVALCFSLPKCQTICKTEPGKTFDFKFDLEAEGLKPVRALGHYIYVRNLPPETTEKQLEQLEKKLKKFGPITSDGIRFNKNETGEYSACVEFESATSKQRAIEASAIRIGGCCFEISEKTSVAPLTQVSQLALT